MEVKYRIGYIDEAKDQVRIYQRKLRKHGLEVIGYEFEKRMTLESLMEQVYKSNIDLLMIDYKLNESNIVAFNGDLVEREFYEKKPLFPHIIFTNKVDQAEPYVEDLKIVFDKQDVFSEEGKEKYFVKMIVRSIEQYRNHLARKKNVVSDLLEKGVKEGLSAFEKDTLLKTQNELQSLDKTIKQEVPQQLLSDNRLEDLSKSKKEAEAFLQSLINKRKE